MVESMMQNAGDKRKNMTCWFYSFIFGMSLCCARFWL